MSLRFEKVKLFEHRHLANHFTASGLVIAQGHVLLIHHKRIGLWLPPGGHLLAGEMPHEAAVREVQEETGVMVEIVEAERPQTGSVDFFFLPQPLCMHAVHAVEDQQDLYHLDIVFLLKPVGQNPGLPVLSHPMEVHAAQWVKLEELNQWSLARNVSEIIALARQRYPGLSDFA